MRASVGSSLILLSSSSAVAWTSASALANQKRGDARVSRATTTAAAPSFDPFSTATSYARLHDHHQHRRRPSSSQLSASFLATVRGGARSMAASESSEEEGATMSNEIFNLVKNIVGAGILGLPAGIAAFGDSPKALLPTMGIISVIGAISAYGFSLIGRVCAMTGASGYREAWEKSVGEKTSWIPSASSAFTCTFANLAYSMILADTFQRLAASVGVQVTRTTSLFGVTGLALLPLCLLKNLSSLAPFSLLGIIGMAFTAVAMTIRCFDGTYAMPAGKFIADVSATLLPQFGNVANVFSPSTLILICMLSSAFLAHFNAPKFYVELRNNTLPRYNTVVATSFALSVAFFGLVAAVGFLTFGKGSAGLILNNYSTKDPIMSLSRVTVALSILFSYPLVFVGTRDGFIDLLKVPKDKRKDNSVLNYFTLALLSVITGLALVVKDLSIVLSLLGATLGNALIYIFPPLMFRSAIRSRSKSATVAQKREVVFALGCAVLGLVMGGIGTKMALS